MVGVHRLVVRNSLAHILTFIVGFGAPVVNGATVPAADPVILRGLKHSAEGQTLLEATIASTNLMTNGRGPKLEPSWVRGEEGTRSALVYLVEAQFGAASTPAVVPRGCSCVFVDLHHFNGWLRVHSTGSGRLSLEPKYLLIYMLLHEVGHLAKKTSGAEFNNDDSSQLNIDPSLAKAGEEDADEFAADLIREHSRSIPTSTTSLEANWVAIELGKLSWNMQAHRTIDEFGAVATGKPLVFFDQNLTHPNLAWRVLRSNYLIQQSKESKELLDAFEESQQRGARPQPIYRRP